MTQGQFTQIDPEAQRVASLFGLGSSSCAAEQLSSHRHLIGDIPDYVPSAPKVELSAVFVPTNRSWDQPGRGLALAGQIAEEEDAQLVIIRSGDAVLTPYSRLLVPDTSRPTAILNLPARIPRALPQARNGHHLVATMHRKKVDTGFKRNLMLALSQLCGYKSLLMFDDDISLRPASQLRPGAIPAQSTLRLDDARADFAEYPSMRAAGYVQRDFNDNSVVCHVRNQLGMEQDSFISGGALLIKCAEDLPFFPSAYNEDWLFFFFLMADGKHSHPSNSVKQAGVVNQAAYDPYRATRARSEELGDVLGEGLFALLNERPSDAYTEATSTAFWRDAIWARQDLIIKLLQEVRGNTAAREGGLSRDMDMALRAALSVYDESEDWGRILAHYCYTLMEDLDEWRQFLGDIANETRDCPLTLEEAFEHRNLSRYVTWLDHRTRRRLSTELVADVRT